MSFGDELYKKLQEIVPAENTTINYLILSILEEKYLDDATYEQIIAESKIMGEEFTLADLTVFKMLKEVIIKKNLPVTRALVRIYLGKMFNEAIWNGKIPNVKSAVIEKDGKEELKFVAR